MSEQPARYLAYLLRLWQTDEGGPWRVLLERVGTGERRGFAGLEELAEFLHAETQPAQAPALHAEGGGAARRAGP